MGVPVVVGTISGVGGGVARHSSWLCGRSESMREGVNESALKMKLQGKVP